MRYALQMPIVPMVSPPDPAPEAADWYLVRSGEVLVVVDDAPGVARTEEAVGVGWPAVMPDELSQRTDTDPVLLGIAEGRLCWAQGITTGSPAPPGTRWAPLRALGAVLGESEWSVAGRAVQLVEWRRTSAFCGRCSTATIAEPAERVVRCPACGLSAYPRLAPAVIVAVERDDELLLARNASFQGRTFSTLAGFVEPGETLEEAVRREVGEEVGVELGAIRYFGSQPWPFPHSLMVGFRARWAAGEPVPDGVEIAEAAWFGVGNLPELPPALSIARRMIDAWCGEHAGGGERRRPGR